jgi:5-methylcytosine-specific restriction enzyme A
MAWRRPVHQAIGAQTTVERKAAYDRAKVRHYGKRRWHHLRLAFLAQNPLCSCGCLRPATVVDHKRPHNGDETLLYDWNNLSAMAKPCHDRKTVLRDGGFGNPVKR